MIDYIAVGLPTLEGDRNKEVIENLEVCIIMLKGLLQGDLSLQDYLF